MGPVVMGFLCVLAMAVAVVVLDLLLYIGALRLLRWYLGKPRSGQ